MYTITSYQNYVNQLQTKANSMLPYLYSLDQEIQQLKQEIYEGDGAQKGNHGMLDERLSHSTSPASPTKPQPPAAPLADDR